MAHLGEPVLALLVNEVRERAPFLKFYELRRERKANLFVIFKFL